MGMDDRQRDGEQQTSPKEKETMSDDLKDVLSQFEQMQERRAEELDQEVRERTRQTEQWQREAQIGEKGKPARGK